MRLGQSLGDSTCRPDTETAVVADAKELTFAEMDALSDRMAAALADNGIARGERILLFMDSSWQAVVSIFAVLKAGAILSPVASSTSAGNLTSLINDCRAAGLITQSRLAAVSAAAMADAPSLRLTVVAGCQGSAAIDGILRFEDAIAHGLPSAIQV